MIGEARVLREQALAEARRAFNISNPFTDYEEMLDTTRPDVAYVLTNPRQVTAIALACLGRGVNTFMEKPAGRDTNETKQLAEAAEKAGVKAMVGVNRRYIPVLRRIREMLGDRRLVHVRSIQCGYCPAVDEEIWQRDRFVDYYGADYFLLDNVHFVDFARWWGGDVRETYAVFESFGRPQDVSWMGQVRFANGGTGGLYSTVLGAEDDRGAKEAYEIHFEGAACYVEQKGGGVFAEVSLSRPERKALVLSSERFPADSLKANGFLAEHEHFVACVRDDALPDSNLADAVKTMELMDAMRESARVGSNIRLR